MNPGAMDKDEKPQDRWLWVYSTRGLNKEYFVEPTYMTEHEAKVVGRASLIDLECRIESTKTRIFKRGDWIGEIYPLKNVQTEMEI